MDKKFIVVGVLVVIIVVVGFGVVALLNVFDLSDGSVVSGNIDGKEIEFVNGSFNISETGKDQILELEGLKFKIPKGYSGEISFNNESNTVSCFIIQGDEVILFSYVGKGSAEDFVKKDTKSEDMSTGEKLSIKNFDLYPVLYTGSGFSARLDFTYSPADSDDLFMVVDYYYFEKDGNVFQMGKGFKYPFSSFTYDGEDLSEFLIG